MYLRDLYLWDMSLRSQKDTFTSNLDCDYGMQGKLQSSVEDKNIGCRLLIIL